MAVATRELTSWLTDRDAGADGADPRLRQRLRLIVASLLLAVLAFVTRPGNIIADTKIDMPLNPVGFLGRALHLWDQEQFGQLQNQVAGYFFPMGPFYAAGRAIGLSPWVVQRLWLTAVMVAAFIGVVKLAEKLGIGSPAAQLVGGLAYALSPRDLSLLGQLSAEALPAAMLPWIILPLITALRGGRRVRAVIRSAVAVALCSGMNAASTLAVLIVPTVFLLAAGRGTPRWRTLLWWCGAVVLATASWSIPLLLQKYGFSWLPYTESAQVTTATTSLPNALRGTEDWVNYLYWMGQPWLPVSYAVSTQPLITLLSGAVSGAGVAGLLRRGLPARRFLLITLLIGIVIVGAGHVSVLHAPFAEMIRNFINGPLAPFRNLRKFDPVIRLPLCLGIIHLLASVRVPNRRAYVHLGALAVVTGVAVPGFVMGLSQSGDFPQVPGYWTQATRWLNHHAGDQGVLAVPGARFGEYLWGRPMDDIMEPLSTTRWGSLSVTATGSVGYTRLLQVVDQHLAAGDGSAGLTQLLARMDVKYLVVRNDLIRDDLDGAWPSRIQQALAASPGINQVATFGPAVGSKQPNDAVSTFDAPMPAVQIYQVSGADPLASLVPASQAVRVAGAPDALLQLADAGLLRDRPVLLNGDGGAPASAPLVDTDSLRRRDRDFGELRSNYTPTLTATAQSATFLATQDLTYPAWAPDETVAQYYGVKDVTASSSASDVNVIPGQSATGYLPFAAVDGNQYTAWETGGWTGPAGQWLQVDFNSPLDPAGTRAAFVDSQYLGPPVSEVAVSTAAGRIVQHVKQAPGPQTLQVPAGPTGWLRIQILRLAYKPAQPVGVRAGISQLVIPGVNASRTIRLPAVRAAGGADPTAITMSLAEPVASGCMPTSLRWECSGQLTKPTEEESTFDRTVNLASSHTARLSGTATFTSPALIAKYTRFGKNEPAVSGSSAQGSDPQQLPMAAFDGNPATSWVASPGDSHPELTIGWHGTRRVSQLAIQRPPGADQPLQVIVSGSGGQTRGGTVTGANGTLRFAPMRTSQLRLIFSPQQPPLQISDISVPGVPHLADPGSAPFKLPCGFGPELNLNGRSITTKISGTFTDVLRELPLKYTACGPVSLSAGGNRLRDSSLDGYRVDSANLDGLSGTGAPPLSSAQDQAPAPANVISWGPQTRRILVAAGQQSYLVVNENYNAGWQARAGHTVLKPVRLDGWKQGWIVPAGTNSLVTLTYKPDTIYRGALFGGLGVVVLFIVISLIPSRRTAPLIPLPPLPVLQPGGRVQVAAVLALSGAAGLWLAGVTGAGVMLASTAGFAAAARWASRRYGPRSADHGPPGRPPQPDEPGNAALRALLSPVLVIVLVVVASITELAGLRIQGAGGPQSVVNVVYDAAPQVLCLIAIGRIAAELAWRAPAEARWRRSGSG